MISDEQINYQSCCNQLQNDSSQYEETHQESTPQNSDKFGGSSNQTLSPNEYSPSDMSSSSSRKDIDQNNHKKKLLQINQISKQQIKPNNMFYLRGELLIDLNFNDFSRISNLNYYKQVRSATILKEYGLLYIDFQIDRKMFDDHTRVINILKNYNDQTLNFLAYKLENHQQSQHKHQEVKSQIQKYTSLNHITQQLIAAKKQQFMHFRKEVLSSLPKDRYFSFVDFSFDYTDQTFKTVGNGMNEKFVQLLGCDLQSMQEIMMRKGILDCIENTSRLKLLNVMLESQRTGNPTFHYEDTIKMITLDDILIDSKFSSDIYFCQSNKIFESFFHSDYKEYLIDRGFLVFEVCLTDFHLKQINSIRQKYIEEYSVHGNYGNIQSQFDHLYKPYILPYKNSSQNLQDSQNMDIESNIPLPKKISQNNEDYTIAGQEINQPIFIEELIADIPYQIQSQYFLDRFYNNNKPQPKKNSNLQDQYPQKTCNYRQINKS